MGCEVRLRCGRRLYLLGNELGGGSLQLDRVLLDDWLGDRYDVVVEEQVVCACRLSEWIY